MNQKIYLLKLWYPWIAVKQTSRQPSLLYDYLLKSVLRLYCFSPQNIPWLSSGRVGITCSDLQNMQWWPGLSKPLTPFWLALNTSAQKQTMAQTFQTGLQSHRVYAQQLWSDHPAFPILWRKSWNNPDVEKMTYKKIRTCKSHILSWYELT